MHRGRSCCGNALFSLISHHRDHGNNDGPRGGRHRGRPSAGHGRSALVPVSTLLSGCQFLPRCPLVRDYYLET